jgi:hypothetical protein
VSTPRRPRSTRRNKQAKAPPDSSDPTAVGPFDGPPRHPSPGTPAPGTIPGKLWNALKAAATAAIPPASLPDGWSQAGATLWRRPAGSTFDPRLPRAVTFNVDLSDASGSAVALVAVIMDTSNQISDADLSLGGANQAQTADQLVVASPHVAAKSVYVR